MTTTRADGTKPLFERRHFEWLAYWAGTTLDGAQASALARALADTNPHFDKARVVDRYRHARKWAKGVNSRPPAQDERNPLPTPPMPFTSTSVS